jgi:FtsH-binding integral membrane protein
MTVVWAMVGVAILALWATADSRTLIYVAGGVWAAVGVSAAVGIALSVLALSRLSRRWGRGPEIRGNDLIE